jgi:hypothetical protein
MTDLSHHHADLKHVFHLQSLKILVDEESVEEEIIDNNLCTLLPYISKKFLKASNLMNISLVNDRLQQV